MSSPPNQTQVLIIGGGPAGSYTATLLSKAGFDVVVLEATKFPRYQIGESMLPSLRSFLRIIGAEDKVMKHGFAVKRGAAVKFNQWMDEGYTDFIGYHPHNSSWNVLRSELDDILLKHAQESGANVFEEHKVLEIHFSKDNQSRPASATYVGPAGEGKIAFDFLVDASGRSGIMSTRYLKNRIMNNSLQNLACWGYWKNVQIYKPNTTRHNAPWFESLTDESGWAWFLPLRDGLTSVGIVMDKNISIEKRKNNDGVLRDHYLSQLKLVPSLQTLLKGASLVDYGVNTVRSVTDFSYAASAYAGDHFRLAGDASAFIDPFFSTGVHLAFLTGLSAALSICASVRGRKSEKEAIEFHNQKVGTAYTRFLLVVSAAYKQIRAQKVPILCEPGETNFDRAFQMMEPIIWGAVDMGYRRPTEEGGSKTSHFIMNVFSSTDLENYKAIGAHLTGGDLFGPETFVLAPEQVGLSAEELFARY